MDRDPTSQPAALDSLDSRQQALEAQLQSYGRLLVAYSGGVDSAWLLAAALDAVGPERVLAVTGVSESLAGRELEDAVALAVRLGARHRVVETREIEDPRYAANAPDRCYYCKSTLFDVLASIAAAEGYDAVADGTNQDDTHDVRPGRQAARERAVVSPLLDAGLTKADVRELSRRRGLPTWDKPEMPCLASRIPHGTPVDVATLRQVEAAEEVLRQCGIRGGRVRYHGDVARVELPPEDLARLADPEFRARMNAGLQAAGFRYAAVDLEGYRRGRQHESAPRADVLFREIDRAVQKGS